MRWLVLVSLLMLAGTAAAQATTSSALPSFFTISPLDRSIGFLMMIFGTVGNVLYDPTLPGRMTAFSGMDAAVNNGMLVLNVILIAYTTLFGLINTAYEGETLGSKLNTVWVPLRAVAGIALLIPTKSGYCIIQIIIMWVVLQGVGAADTVWTAALKAIQVQGSSAILPLPPGQGPNPGGGQDAIVNGQIIQFQTQKKIQDILTDLVCVHLYISGYNKNLTTDDWAPTKITDKSNSDNYLYDFTKLPKYGTNNGPLVTTCGNVGYAKPDSQTANSIDYYQVNAIDGSLNSVMTNLNEAAKEFVYNNGKIAGDPITAAALVMQDSINQAMEDYQAWLVANSNVGKTCNATSGDISLNTGSLNSLDCASQFGWSFAGAYYRTITIQSGSIGTIPYFYDKLTVSTPYLTSPSSAGGEGTLPATKDDLLRFQQILENDSTTLSPILISSNQLLSGGAGTDFGQSMGTPLNFLLDWIVQTFVSVIVTGGKGDLIDGRFIAAGTDPVADLQHMGERIVDVVELLFIIFFTIEIILLIIGGSCAGINPLASIVLIVLKVSSFFMFIMGLLFTFGLVMSVYIPLIPFIIFFFGVMAWLMGVVEAMLAGPMVAIGIAAPEGHDVVGRAQPAVMLLTNVFIRPTLMVFGLIAGIILSDVGVALLNSVYEFVIQVDANYVNSSGAPVNSNTRLTDYGIGPFQLVSYMGVYVSIIVILINKCFGMIHVIPDQVLNWIGGQNQFGAYTGGADEVEGRSGIAQTGGESMKGMQKKMDTRTKGMEKEAEKKEDKGTKETGKVGKAQDLQAGDESSPSDD